MGIEIPEQHGGAGGNLLMTVLAVEELSAVDASVAIFVDVQNTLVNNLLLKWASTDVKRRYLPRLAIDLLGAYALSEPQSGSDAFGLQTKATKRGDNWVLEGRKLWITNGAEAGLFIIFANADFSQGYKGITAFAVERGFKGFSVGKNENKLGIRASDRKSTRLNSSHGYISYAVFCLKKKNDDRRAVGEASLLLSIL